MRSLWQALTRSLASFNFTLSDIDPPGKALRRSCKRLYRNRFVMRERSLLANTNPLSRRLLRKRWTTNHHALLESERSPSSLAQRMRIGYCHDYLRERRLRRIAIVDGEVRIIGSSERPVEDPRSSRRSQCLFRSGVLLVHAAPADDWQPTSNKSLGRSGTGLNPIAINCCETKPARSNGEIAMYYSLKCDRYVGSFKPNKINLRNPTMLHHAGLTQGRGDETGE